MTTPTTSLRRPGDRGPVRDLPEPLQWIPVNRVHPIIRQVLTTDGISRVQLSERIAARHPGTQPQSWERTLTAIAHGDRATMTFRVVDAILCAIGRVDAWHHELADLYEVPARELAS